MYQVPAVRAGIGCGNVREEEGRCRGNTGPKGRRTDLISMFRARLLRDLVFRGLLGQSADHRAVQTQIGEFAIRQGRQFVNRLTVQAIPYETGFHGFNQCGDTKRRGAFQRGLCACDCHLRHPFVLVATDIVRRLLDGENRQMLRLHNTSRRQCCYAASAWIVGIFRPALIIALKI